MVKRSTAPRQVRRTVLIVCEGKRDRAFLLHLRSLYCSGNPRGPNVTAKEAGGKGGNNVADTLLATMKFKAYDLGVAFTEADAPPSNKFLHLLRPPRARIVVAEPCLEGMLLRIAGRPVPETSQACKQAAEALAGNDLYLPEGYAQHWPKAVLEASRHAIPELEALVACFERAGRP